jgi:hypothetical protein
MVPNFWLARIRFFHTRHSSKPRRLTRRSGNRATLLTSWDQSTEAVGIVRVLSAIDHEEAQLGWDVRAWHGLTARGLQSSCVSLEKDHEIVNLFVSI